MLCSAHPPRMKGGIANVDRQQSEFGRSLLPADELPRRVLHGPFRGDDVDIAGAFFANHSLAARRSEDILSYPRTRDQFIQSATHPRVDAIGRTLDHSDRQNPPAQEREALPTARSANCAPPSDAPSRRREGRCRETAEDIHRRKRGWFRRERLLLELAQHARATDRGPGSCRRAARTATPILPVPHPISSIGAAASMPACSCNA